MQLERARELASLLDDSRLSEGPSRALGYSASALPVRSARARERASTLSACLCECLRARGFFFLAPQAQTSGMPLICLFSPSLCAGATTKDKDDVNCAR